MYRIRQRFHHKVLNNYGSEGMFGVTSRIGNGFQNVTSNSGGRRAGIAYTV